MRIGDLVTLDQSEDLYGVIVDFKVVYDKYGDPQDKFVVVNWGQDFPNEEEYMEDIRVMNETR